MSGFRVELGFLAGIVGPLRQGVEAARQLQADTGQLESLAADCGVGQVPGAATECVQRWGFAGALVVDDAEHVATGVERAGQAYADTEHAVAGAATRLAAAVPGGGGETS